MKKRILTLIFVLIVIFSSISLASCKKDKTKTDNQTEPTNTGEVLEEKISLNYKSIAMYETDTFTLVSTVENYDGVISYESSDLSVATVDANGVVTALKQGNAVISAKTKEAIATCTVKVDQKDIFTFSSNEKNLYVNKTSQLSLNHFFKGEEVKNAVVTYTSSDDKVVSVDDNGYITGLKVGEAIITAKYNDLISEIKINVLNLITLSLDVTEVVLNPNLNTNNKVSITASVKKNGINVKDATIIWSSLDEEILKLNADKNKVTVTANGCGNTALIATYEGEVATCIITSFKTVSTIEDMEGIKSDINGWFKLVNDIDFTGYSWDSITPWMGDPVVQELYFGGIFDGCGYTLSNINCLAGWHKGLFGLINKNAVVKNVSIINLVNQATSNKSGSVVSLNYGRVENVYVETTIQGDSQSMWNAHGGLVACNHPDAIMRNCIVKVNASRVFKNTGALVGYNCGLLENCYAICTDAVLPTVYTYSNDLGEINNSYTYTDESLLYGIDMYKDYDKSIWCLSNYALASLKSFPNASFAAEDTYLTIGKEYRINPFNVKGLDASWDFVGDNEAFDYYFEEDGTLNVLPLSEGEMEISVSLSNGHSAKTTLISKGVILVPNANLISLDYLNPRLDSEFMLSFVDEDNNIIANENIEYIVNNEAVINVTADGTIKAVGGGKTTISLRYQDALYVDIIDVDVCEWIQISTIAQFNAIKDNPMGMYCLVNDIDYLGGTYKTIGKWDGDETNGLHFGGTFDGNGYTISNLVIPSAGDTSGIWGQTLDSSVICNVNFINISGSTSTTDCYGIVGFNCGLIENVYVEMSVTTGGKADYRAGGGIAGTNEFRGIIRNSISVIKVDNLPDNQYFGGLAGLNQGLIENSFTIIYGNDYAKVNTVSFENGASLNASAYIHEEYQNALSQALAKEAPFGTFNPTIWVIEKDQLPTLKKHKGE